MDLGSELKKHRKTLDFWARLAKIRKKPPKEELMKTLKEVEPLLVEMKIVMNVFERVVYKLKQMEPYQKKGILKGDLKKGFRVRQFYRQMNKKIREVNRMFRRVRFAVKLYMIMNDGHFPGKRERIKFDQDFKNYKSKL